MSRNQSHRKGARKKALFNWSDLHVSKELIYAEREIWSPQYQLWTRFHVRKPRLPIPDDSSLRWVDEPHNSPSSFQGFVGGHNFELFQNLDNLCNEFEHTKQFPDILTIAGPSGSGKTSIAKIFAQKLCDEAKLFPSQASKWILQLDAKPHFQNNELSLLWNKINRFADNPLEKYIPSKYRIVMIDNFEFISPSNQQPLKNIINTFTGKLKFIFICQKPEDCMVAFVLNRATIHRTRRIQESDALVVITSILYRNRIGFDRLGVKKVFDVHTDFSLSKMIDLLQKVFVERQYISEENVIRVAGLKVDPPLISPSVTIEPFERCEICTLVPPCQHITIEELNQYGLEVRRQLPRYRDGSMTCPEFARYGRCSIFNKYGHCSLDHPKNIHIVTKPIVRCAQCTLPWPCNHCAYNTQRNTLRRIIDQIRDRIGRLRQLVVPDPPLMYSRHLEMIVGWKDKVATIHRKYIQDPHPQELLKQVEDWIENGHSIVPLAYQQRMKLLVDAFGDLYISTLLDPARFNQTVSSSTNAVQSSHENNVDTTSVESSLIDSNSLTGSM